MAERFDCPKCKAPLEAHEVSPGTVVHHCPACFGVLYRKGTLAVPLDLTGLAPARWDCPNCRKTMESGSAYERSIEVDRCKECGALWFDAGEIQILRRLTGVENVAGPPGSSEPKKKEKPAEPAPKAEKAGAAAPARTSDEPQKIPQPRDMSSVRNPDADKSPSVTYQGRVYQHFQTSLPVTTSVLGEFPWIAVVGDTAKLRDFVCPPYLVSQEVTEKESSWTHGEYVEPEEVWAWFGMPGNPPPKNGVGPAQPNPWEAHAGAVWTAFALGAAACFAAWLFFAVIATNRTVYDGGFGVAAAEPEKSRVGDVFEVPGRTSNLEITLDTNIDGRWAYVSMALIDAESGAAIDFGREVSYYHGFEDGESWSEGRPRETFIVPSVPPGRYYLRVEPETDAPQLSFRVVVRRDVPLLRLPFIAMLLLVLPALWASIRRGSFENERWMESDHPRVSDEDWEEDE